MRLALGWASLGSSSLRSDAPAPAVLAPVEPLGFSSVFSPVKQKSPSLRQGSSLSDREGLLGAERLALGWASLGSSSLRSDAPAPALLAPVEPLGFSSVFSPHKQKSPSLRWGFFVCLAEREGFEPSIRY